MAFHDKENQKSFPNVGMNNSTPAASRKVFGSFVRSPGQSSLNSIVDKENMVGGRHISTAQKSHSMLGDLMSASEEMFSVVGEDSGELRIHRDDWEVLKTEIHRRIDLLLSDNEELAQQLESTKIAGHTKIKDLEAILEQHRYFFS